MRPNIFFSVLSGVVIAAIIAFVTLSQSPQYVEAQHGDSGRYSKAWITHDFEEVLTSTAGISITTGIINTSGLQKTNRALITVSGRAIKYTLDGSTAPTTSVGTPLAIGGILEIVGLTDIQNFSFISDDAPTTTATCHVHLQYEAEMN